MDGRAPVGRALAPVGRAYSPYQLVQALPTGALPSGFLTYWSYTTASVTVLYVRSFNSSNRQARRASIRLLLVLTCVYKPRLPKYLSLSQTWKRDLVPRLFITSATRHDYG